MEVTVIQIVIGAYSTVAKGLLQGLEKLEYKRMRGGHPNYSIVEISKNTKMSSGDLKRLAFT